MIPPGDRMSATDVHPKSAERARERRDVQAELPSPSQQPAVPLTLEGSSILHHMLRFDWASWRTLGAGERNSIVTEATAVLEKMERRGTSASALYSLLGHK